jgi:hypothetical protein
VKTSSFSTDEGENMTMFSKDRTKAALGLGDGFNSHAGTGTIASANEQKALRAHNEGTSMTDALSSEDADAAAFREAMFVAVLTKALNIHGFNVSYSVVTPNGNVELSSTDAYSTMAKLGTSLTVSVTTDLPLEDVAGARTAVVDTITSALASMDDNTNIFTGNGAVFSRLMAASKVVSLTIGKGSEFDKIVAAASKVAAAAKAVATDDVFAVSTADLGRCPVCSAATTRTDLVCPNGHESTAVLRAKQEAKLIEVAVSAANEAKLSLSFNTKVKGAPRATVSADMVTPASLVSYQDITAIIDGSAIIDPLQRLRATTIALTAFEAGVAALRAGDVAMKSRVCRTVGEALSKAADNAAAEFAAPAAEYMIQQIVAAEQELSSRAFAASIAEYDAEMRRRSQVATPKSLKQFAEQVNKNGQLTSTEEAARIARRKAKQRHRNNQTVHQAPKGKRR